MSTTPAADQQQIALATLTCLAEPADPVAGGLLRALGPVELLACIRSGTVPASAAGVLGGLRAARPVLARCRSQLHRVPPDAGLGSCQQRGIRLVCPGDPDWPKQLDDLGAARPYALWVRGTGSLHSCCQRAVSVVGSRAATPYGMHVGTEIAASLSGEGWSVVSGAAHGIDAAAHSGALVAGGTTVAVLPCGVDYAYPRGHQALLAGVAERGVIVSEYPPGQLPARRRFLARNRIIAALTAGTVVVEAGLRGGTLTTARHACALGRPVMAVPGPVTSTQSAGCHQLICDHGATCVTSASDVIACVSEATADSHG